MSEAPKRAAFLTVTAACICLFAVPLLAAAGSPAAARGKRIRAVIVTGGHGYDKKLFPKTFQGHDDIDFRIDEGKAKPKAASKPPLFGDITKWPYDVIVLYNFRQKLSAAQRSNFLKLLDRGVGLVILHHAIAAYPAWPEFDKILGARYYLRPEEKGGVKHAPSIWKHGVRMKIHVEDPNHPITKGLKDFEVTDETYGKWSYFKGNHLLLSIDHPLANKQIAWTRDYRKARVFFIQLGHGPTVFNDTNYRALVARAIRWTSRRLGAGASKGAAGTRTRRSKASGAVSAVGHSRPALRAVKEVRTGSGR